MEAMSPVHLGIIIAGGFLPFLIGRPFLVNRLVEQQPKINQAKQIFYLDLYLCISAAALISIHNYFVLSFPLTSLLSLLIGCIIAGFYIGLHSSLLQERKVIHYAMQQGEEELYNSRFFPITLKISVIAITTSIFVAIVLILVFTRDIEWLIRIAGDPDSISTGRRAVMLEIFYIVGVLLLLIMNLIFSFSKNLRLLFNNQTQILEKVRQGDLGSKVAVATNDEFGIIASHTNHMIDGLRHRFDLVREIKLAEEVQQALLPSKSPFLENFDVSGFSLYCDQTGGDYYDYFILPDDKFGVVVADACGHGLGAAMLMTSLRAYLVSNIDSYEDPATLMNNMNNLITRDCRVNGRFSTMFFLEIDVKNRELCWIRAGHDPPLLFHSESETFSKLEGNGLVLGVDDSFVYSTHVTDGIDKGDILLIGTDGIYETRNSKNEMFGLERVKEIILKNRHEPAHTIREHLVSEVTSHRGEMDQEDDITLVVIKVK